MIEDSHKHKTLQNITVILHNHNQVLVILSALKSQFVEVLWVH